MSMKSAQQRSFTLEEVKGNVDCCLRSEEYSKQDRNRSFSEEPTSSNNLVKNLNQANHQFISINENKRGKQSLDKKFNELKTSQDLPKTTSIIEEGKTNTFSSRQRTRRKRSNKDIKKTCKISSSGGTKSKNYSSNQIPKDNLSTVLIVDDTLFMLQLMENLFEQINIKVDTAISGEFAITKCL